MNENINVVKSLPAVGQPGERVRELDGGNLYEWREEQTIVGKWHFVEERPRGRVSSPQEQFDADREQHDGDDANGPAITSPAAGQAGEGLSEQSREHAADSVIDDVTGSEAPKGYPTDGYSPDNGYNESDPPPSQPPEPETSGAARPLSEEEIERLTKARRKQAREKLDAERDDSQEQK